MKKDLPIIEYKVDEETGAIVNFVSLVEYPAIQSNFLFFNEKGTLNFSSNDEKRELIGLAMIPDEPIDRLADDGSQYLGVFSKDTIRQIAQTYAKKGFFHNTNIEHSFIPAESFIFQSYLTDKANGIFAPKGIITPKGDVPDGSWVIGVKVCNDSVWENIKSGKLKGFSIEGIFKMIEKQFSINKPLSELEKALIELEELSKDIN